MSNSRMRAPALAGVATVRGARGAPGPTLRWARGTMNEPTSVPAPRAILAEVSSDAGRDPHGGQLLWRDQVQALRCDLGFAVRVSRRVMVLSAVGISRRMMVSETPAS
jgi:hypothetical protein